MLSCSKKEFFDHCSKPLMVSQILSKSSVSKLEPLGRHNPLSKRSSLTPFTNETFFSNTGCKCMGFHKGLDSIFSFSRAVLIFSLMLKEGVNTHVNHLLE